MYVKKTLLNYYLVFLYAENKELNLAVISVTLLLNY